MSFESEILLVGITENVTMYSHQKNHLSTVRLVFNGMKGRSNEYFWSEKVFFIVMNNSGRASSIFGYLSYSIYFREPNHVLMGAFEVFPVNMYSFWLFSIYRCLFLLADPLSQRNVPSRWIS